MARKRIPSDPDTQHFRRNVRDAINKWLEKNGTPGEIKKFVATTLDAKRRALLFAALGIKEGHWGEFEIRDNSIVGREFSDKLTEVAREYVEGVLTDPLLIITDEERAKLVVRIKDRYLRAVEDQMREHVDKCAKQDIAAILSTVSDGLAGLMLLADEIAEEHQEPKPKRHFSFAGAPLIDSAEIITISHLDGNKRFHLSVDNPDNGNVWFLVRLTCSLCELEVLRKAPRGEERVSPPTKVTTTIITDGEKWYPADVYYAMGSTGSVIDPAKCKILDEFRTKPEAIFYKIGPSDLDLIKRAVLAYTSKANESKEEEEDCS